MHRMQCGKCRFHCSRRSCACKGRNLLTNSLVTPLEVIRLELDDAIQPDTLLDDSEMDSLEFIELIRRLEQVFEIRIEESDLECVATFGELISLVDRKRIAAGTRPVASQLPS